MKIPQVAIKDLTLTPLAVHLYIPPIIWKGDCVGHIGEADTFFWVLEGECFLNIDSQYYLIRPGQLAFLPKGKLRSYTHASEPFCMYEMAFEATLSGRNLMESLELTTSDFVVDIPEKEEISRLFEHAFRKELFKNPIYDLSWCANIIEIIRYYTENHQKLEGEDSYLFAPVLDYMRQNLSLTISTNQLADLIHMQPNYFIRRFKATYGIPPISYLNRLRLYRSMELLSSTKLSMEEIAKEIGMADTSYFARFFKKNSGATPSEYRKSFRM